jgi:hypothetical protein
MADTSHIPGTPDWWLQVLAERLMRQQPRYQILADYADGNHPVPNGDHRFVAALQELQRKAQTNYVSLANEAVADRMRVKAFRFGPHGQPDKDAQRIWAANNMALQSVKAIQDGAEFGESYSLVNQADEPGGEPIITVEDPRQCIVEPDPLRPFDPTKALAGLKLYREFVTQRIVSVVYLPEATYIYASPVPGASNPIIEAQDFMAGLGSSVAASGLQLVDVIPNQIGAIPLIHGRWRPSGKAECENGAFDIQDRINWTMLSKLVIMKAQAYRQRMISGGPKRNKKGAREDSFEPGADAVWVLTNENAKVWDLEQADITQILESARDDIGDFAAVTQTPITYLTNKISNVAGDTFFAAQSGLVSKARSRMESMGWYFEAVMKTCFRYKSDPRATEVEAETMWNDPAIRDLADQADAATKFVAAGIALEVVGDRIGLTPDEIEFTVKDRNRREAEAHARETEMQRSGSAPNSPGGN